MHVIRYLFRLIFISFGSLFAFEKSFSENNISQCVIAAHNNQEVSSIDDLLPGNVLVTESLINSAMPDLKQSKLGKVLTRYYKRSFGGATNWDKIKSVKISGYLKSLSKVYEYESISKKPNLYKLSISFDGAVNEIAFKGKDLTRKRILARDYFPLWILDQTDKQAIPTEIFSNLLFPLRKNIGYKYFGVVRKFNSVCHQIRFFDSHSIIDYFIDVESYFINSIIIDDANKESNPVIISYSDYRITDGVYFAHSIETFIDGELHASLNIDSVATNVGALNWMFILEGSDQ